MTPVTRRPPPLHWLTVLRYPAALWVILVHVPKAIDTNQPGFSSLDWFIKSFMDCGYLGVSFFFMLSGFVLAYNYPVMVSKVEYLSARAARILPVYYLSLVLSVPLLFSQINDENINTSLLYKMGFVLTLTQAWIPSISGFWNGPGWTLSCEAFFYTCLIFILAPLKQWVASSMGRTFLFLSVCFLLGLAAPAWYYLHYPDASLTGLGRKGDSWMKTMKVIIERFPVIRLLDFVAGVVLCLSLRAHLPRLARFSLIFVALGLAQVLSSLYLPFIFSMGTYCLPGFSLILVGAAALPFPNLETSGRFVRFLAATGLVLGNASYAVYLLHASVIDYLQMFNPSWFYIFPTNGEMIVWAYFASAALITTILSIAIYFLYEEPSRQMMKQGLVQLADHFWEKKTEAVMPWEGLEG